MIGDTKVHNLVENESIEFELPEKVENRSSNIYGITAAKYEDISKDYFNLVRRLLLNDSDKAYDLLTDEMKNKYSSKEQFVNFINNNYKNIYLLTYSNYYVKNNNDGNLIFKSYNQDDKVCINIYFLY